MLVVPVASLDALALGGQRLAHVWSDPSAVGAAEAVARGVGVGVTVRDDVADHPALAEIADLHPGETVLVVSSKATSAVEVVADADGWARRPWSRSE